MSRVGRVAAAVLMVGAVSFWSVPAPPVGAGEAEAPAELLGYETYASAPGVEVRIDLEGSIVNPIFQGRIPEATSEITTGPNGHGLAALFWPGSVGGNFGTTVQQINRLCMPSTPLCVDITPEMKAALLPLNDPMRAETFSPAGPSEASFPPGAPPADPGGALYMYSTAADRTVTAQSGITTLNIPGVISGTMASASVAELSEAGDVVSSLATMTTSGLEIAGVLRIGSLEAIATSASNGAGEAKVDARTIISGVDVLGVPASIDGNGLTLQGSNTPLGPVLDPVLQGVEQALAEMAFTVDVLTPTASVNGPQGEASAGAVVIKFSMGGQLHWTIMLGAATSSVNASGGFGEVPFELPPVPATTLPFEPTSPLGGEGALGDSSAGGATTEMAAPPAGSGGTANDLTNGFLNTSAGFGGLEGAAIVAAVIVAFVLAAGLRRLSDNVLAAAASACPLEGNSSS